MRNEINVNIQENSLNVEMLFSHIIKKHFKATPFQHCFMFCFEIQNISTWNYSIAEILHRFFRSSTRETANLFLPTSLRSQYRERSLVWRGSKFTLTRFCGRSGVI